MNYITISSTDLDFLFEQLTWENNLEYSVNLLNNHGFEKIKGGSFSKQVWHNGNLLIKFFDNDNYKAGKVFEGFIDYDVYLKADISGISLIPTIYGYCKNRFMVTQYEGPLTLYKGTDIKFNAQQVSELAYDLFTQLIEIYKLTGYVIDDVDGKNIVYNKDKNSFHLVDLSCVASFSSAYFVREYVTLRLNRMFEGFFHKGWIKRNELLSAQKVINELTFNSIN